MRRPGWVVAALALACTGRAGPPPRVEREAAADLGCPRSELVFLRAKNDAYRIRGCGQEVNYTIACTRGGCDWRRDGAPHPLAQWRSPATHSSRTK